MSTTTMTTATRTTSAPDTCPTCGADELLFTTNRRQFKCGGAVVNVGSMVGWSQNWPCVLPRKDEDADAADGAQPGLRGPAQAAPSVPVVGPVASLEVVDGTPAEPHRMRVAFVGGIGDWNDLHAWSRTNRTAEDHIRRTLEQEGRTAVSMAGVGAAAAA